ncbi:hypothetical protein Bca4012_037544 [Brassica carinata]|uniref:Uncharacterized protein n=1 Tax=Brassica carinata TaxID=52824 RepID=A0A8X8B878_BRACI|nr:hypothetical protein Bca52824_011087 [Brassica carinata]
MRINYVNDFGSKNKTKTLKTLQTKKQEVYGLVLNSNVAAGDWVLKSTSPDSLLSAAKALAIASPAISSTNRHPLVYCADSTSICSLIQRLSADSNLNELVIGYEEEEEQILNMGHDYSYSQPSESEEYGGYTVDSGYSET